jgi:DNA mismatch repair ATPase MutS
VGQQYLYDRLRRVPLEPEITENDNTIQYLKKNMESTDRLQKLLSKLAHKNAYYISSLFQNSHPELSPLMKQVIKILQFLPLLSVIVFIFFQNIMLFIIACSFFIVNMIIHYRNKLILSAYLHSVPQLFKLVFIAKKLSIETPFNKLSSDIKKSLQSIQPIISYLSYFKYDDKIENDMAIIFLAVKELLNIFFLLEPNILFRSFRLFVEKKADIEAIFAYVGNIDMLQALAALQKELPYYCKPQWTDAGLQTTDVYHPLIEHCIPNTLNTEGKSVLLTGSNMSGKTTFIRIIALNMLCANTLDMCFARSFSGRRMMIHSAINLHDNLLESQSFYMKEVLAVKDMLEKTRQSGFNLFILDEIYKGTNTPERIASGKAVLSELAKNGNMVFASTHDIELADLLAGEYELYHFCEQIEQNRLHFDYLLKRGKLKHRNAIRLLEIEGYPKNVIAEAISIAGKL